MNRILNTIGHKLIPLIYWFQHRKITSYFNFVNNFELIKNSKILYDVDTFFNNIQIKDKNWCQIRLLSASMWNDCFKWKCFRKILNNIQSDKSITDTEVYFDSNSIICKSGDIENNWIVLLYEKKLSESFIIEFNAIIYFPLSEFQVAFNFKNLGERYRFNLRDCSILCFDVVYGGFFHNNIITKPISIELKKVFNVKISISKEYFQYILNDKILMTVHQENELVSGGSIALILWNRESNRINVEYSHFSIYEIVE